jgi:hypothetical protein
MSSKFEFDQQGHAFEALEQREEERLTFGLSLFQPDADKLAAAWVADVGGRSVLKYQYCRGIDWGPVNSRDGSGKGDIHDVQIASDMSGHGWLVWSEYQGTSGDIYICCLKNDTVLSLRHAIETPAALGEFEILAHEDEGLLIVAEIWVQSQTRIGLFHLNSSELKMVEEWGYEADFNCRPRICGSFANGLLSWDQYKEGKYNVVTRFISDGVLSKQYSSTESTGWKSLSAVLQTSDGRSFLAYSRDELVMIEPNAVNWHSNICVEEWFVTEEKWKITHETCIDFAMNPWMAAYVGRRRQPHLREFSTKGPVLLWEMKQDVASMSPNPGQLRLLFLGNKEARAEHIVMDGACWFVPSVIKKPAEHIWVGTKTQIKAREFPMKYRVKKILPGSHPTVSALSANDGTPLDPIQLTTSFRGEDWGSFKLLFGDPHAHSWLSGDLEGDLDEMYHFARDIAQLDFVSFTENDFTIFTDPLRKDVLSLMRRYANFFNEDNKFTALFGWEYTKTQDLPADHWDYTSHRCVLFPGDDGPFYTWKDWEVKTPPDLVHRLKGVNCLLHAHHLHHLDLTDDELERNVQISTSWGNLMLNDAHRSRIHTFINHGFRIGFFGASDSHQRNPGLGGPITGAWCKDHSRAGVYEAFYSRRVFCTTGLRPMLKFEINGRPMGEALRVDSVARLKVAVKCHRAINTVEIIRDGEIAHQIKSGSTECGFEWVDPVSPKGLTNYYVHVVFEGEEPEGEWCLCPVQGIHAWTSPIWVRLK